MTHDSIYLTKRAFLGPTEYLGISMHSRVVKALLAMNIVCVQRAVDAAS